jgi:soluble lytic murein transglycosylase-like protein
MKFAAVVIGLACLPVSAQAAVFEVGDDGSLERLDTPVVAATTARDVRARSMTTVTSTARAATLRPVVQHAAARYSVSPALVDAIAHVESRYRSDAVSRAGAQGVMQLMPGTARDLGVDARDPAANIRGGTAYLRQLLDRFDGDVVRTVAAYNAGPGAVARAGGVPRFAETRAYVAAVLDRLAAGAQ